MKTEIIKPGYLTFHLRSGILVHVGPNYAIQIVNGSKDISLSLSGCGTQMALHHPQGRVLQCNARVEMHTQSQSFNVYRNAKIWPRGVSFTASNCAIVYLVDTAGTRSTSDNFHDLYYEDNTTSM